MADETNQTSLSHARDYVGIARKYADDVLSGKVVAGKLVRLACKRHLDDLAKVDWPYVFDAWCGNDVCDFIEKLPHVEGEWKTPTIFLEPPQVFILVVIFGWRRRSDGGRRFSTVHIEMARKAGKAEWVENLLPTPDGFRRMGDIQPGDLVFGSDGRPVRVKAVTEIMTGLECMALSVATGERFIVAADHLWPVNQRVCARNQRRPWTVDDDSALRAAWESGGSNAACDALPHRSRHAVNRRASELGATTNGKHYTSCRRLSEPRIFKMPDPPSVISTKEISQTLFYGTRQDSRYSISVAPAIELPECDLAIPPYTLGAWLGDGTSSCAAITTSHSDVGIIERIRLDGISAEGRKYPSKAGSNCGLYALGRGKNWHDSRANGLHSKLRNAGLLNNKHIPASYLRSSIRQRMDLLRGLMDTDGTVNTRGHCSFTNCNRRLAEDVHELISSLGMKAHWREKDAKLNGRVVGTCYTIEFHPPAGVDVFALERKLARQSARKRGTRADTRSVISVESVPSVPVKCIEVDAEDGIYLTGRSFIPTHNSSLTAGVALYCLCCEDEPGPQIIIGATTGDQAKKVFDPARKMVAATPTIRSAFQLEALSRSIPCGMNGGYIQTINAKGQTQDGWNPHVGILDELHAHKSRSLFDVIKSAFGARKNPLLWIITTAGFDTNGVCYEQRTMAIKVLEGTIQLDHLFAVIFTIDDDDDPFDEAVWPKANPMIGVTPTWEKMRADAADAKASPSEEGNFKTKNLNIWLNAASAWLNMTQWKKCGDTALSWDDFKGLDCWIGGDLADKNDITALVLAAFDEDGRLIFKPRFWLPDAVLRDPKHAEGRGPAPYRTWSTGEDAPLTLTRGDWVDHNEVEQTIRDWIEQYSVKRVTFDQFAAAQAMASRLNEDFGSEDEPFAEVLHKQAAKITDAAKELEARVKVGPAMLRHDSNPVMDWMASNCVVSRRRDETLLPIKESQMSPNKIDGIDALINAIHPALLVPEKPKLESYLTRADASLMVLD